MNTKPGNKGQGNSLQEQIRRNREKLFSRLVEQFDYIVCGSGSSGSVVAGRLAENPKISVLLLEAGGSDDIDTVMDPNQWVRTLGGELDWGFKTSPNSNLNGRAIAYSMGKVLGGGSSINVGTWSRGHQADWDRYATEAGDPAWNYDSVLEVYHRIEDWHGAPDPQYRGTGGPVFLQQAPDPDGLFQALIEGSESCGIPQFENANGRMMEAEAGSSYTDEIVRDHKRQSIFRSYVYPLMDQPNLTVLTGALVTRVILEHARAVGVEFTYQGNTIQVKTSREVILSLGAIHTPKVLMQSGIGETAHLASFGIPVVKELPGVGRNLHDHIAIGCVWESTGASKPNEPRSKTVTFWKSRAELAAPNLYMYLSPHPMITPENAPHFQVPGPAWSLYLGMRPASRGSVTLTGAAPTDPVKIDAGYLSDPADLQDIIKGIAMCRAVGNSEAFKPYAKQEIVPRDLSGTEMERFIRDGLTTFWHQSGTAKMGLDGMSVVDGRLRVYGIDGLRVADASILPHVTTGNTMAPCVVIGEQAASFILSEQG